MGTRNYTVITPDDPGYEFCTEEEASDVGLDLVHYYKGNPIFIAKVVKMVEQSHCIRPVTEDDLID